MGALDGLFVDRIDLLPQVICGRSEERGSRIDVTRSLENARPDCRKNGLDGLDDTVVERVHSAHRFGFADAPRDQQFHIASLDLDVHCGPVSDDIERFSQGRNATTVGERESLQLRCGQLGDGLSRGPLWEPAVYDGIVVNDDNAVASRVHVQLYSISSKLDGALECGKRVLGMRLVRPAVSDPLWRVAACTCGQAFLPVVAFCSMSAKL
jgi:hypothetical protein